MTSASPHAFEALAGQDLNGDPVMLVWRAHEVYELHPIAGDAMDPRHTHCRIVNARRKTPTPNPVMVITELYDHETRGLLEPQAEEKPR